MEKYYETPVSQPSYLNLRNFCTHYNKPSEQDKSKIYFFEDFSLAIQPFFLENTGCFSPLLGPIYRKMDISKIQSENRKNSALLVSDSSKVTDINFYRIKKKLQQEGFDLLNNKNGTLTLVLRLTEK